MKTPADAAGRRAAGGEAAPLRASVKIRLADGSSTDCRTGIHLAREAHLHTIFRDIPFSETKARAIYDKAMAEPDRFGLIYAVPGAERPLAEDGLLGFASVQAGEHFLGTGTLLGGKVALRLVHAMRHWAKTRSCAHLMVHVTTGENAEDADRFFRRCWMVTIGGKYLLHTLSEINDK
ncbi:hypothetical protein [Roseibium marinum]|uniref:N-acetyltransferase domain-containing protein n=1 Tax=Roseibium marinum TaxID=281252 RepID=A0A2S3UKB8_9HYPH|nr:hypothetical protein [Roseibium marinum]POF28115.1 hypothetical protein CLV41_11749 [Roseibium marinum]